MNSKQEAIDIIAKQVPNNITIEHITEVFENSENDIIKTINILLDIKETKEIKELSDWDKRRGIMKSLDQAREKLLKASSSSLNSNSNI